MALHILDQLLQQQIGVAAVQHNTGHPIQAKLQRRPLPSPAVHDLVPLAAQRDHAQWLEQTLLADCFSQTINIAGIFPHALGIELKLLRIEIQQLHMVVLVFDTNVRKSIAYRRSRPAPAAAPILLATGTSVAAQRLVDVT